MNPLAAVLDSASAVGAEHFHNTPDTNFSAVVVLTTIIDYVTWLVTAVAIGSLINVGVSWAISNHNGEQENLRSLGRWGQGVLLAATVGQLANTIFGFNLFTPHPQAIPGLTAVQHWLNILTAIGMAIGVLGMLLVALRRVLNHRNGEPMGENLLYVFGGALIITTASSITYGLLPW